MKKAENIIFALMIFAGVTSAQAVYFEAGLETITTGSIESGVGDSSNTTDGRWHALGGLANPDPSIVDTHAHTGSKSMRLSRGGGRTVVGWTTGYAVPDGTLFEMSIWVNIANDNGSLTISVNNYDNIQSDQPVSIYITDDQDIRAWEYGDDGDEGWRSSGVIAAVGSWTGVRVVLTEMGDGTDTVAGRGSYDVYVNTGSGWTRVMQDIGFISSRLLKGVNSVLIRPQGSDGITGYIDDVAIMPSPPIRITGLSTLEAKAETIERLLSKEWVSPEGLIYSMVLYETNKRITQDDILRTAPDPDKLEPRDLLYVKDYLKVVTTNGKPQYLLQGIPLEDVESYEDCLQTTSTYLSGLYFKYLATSDPEVLDQSHEVFMALYSVYELGLQEQRGWIPKPYGFQCTKQSSMDNQCPYYMSMIRYYKIAPEEDKARIQLVLTDMMDYWMRNKYKYHVLYFGTEVDYASNRFYPGHWQLFFLPLAHSVWEMTGDEKYLNEYNELLKQLEIEKGEAPAYLRENIRLYHRMYLQYAGLLEMGAPPRSLWLKGLKYQEAAMPPLSIYHTLTCAVWVDDPKTAASKIDWLKEKGLPYGHEMKDFLFHWPSKDQPPKTRAFMDQTVSTLSLAIWFKTYWQGRYTESW